MSTPGVRDLRVPMRLVSGDDRQWFFGYYEKSPWNRSQSLMLACICTFADRQPRVGEHLELAAIDLRGSTAGGASYRVFDRTTQWSWQQGTMLQWLGPEQESTVIYNRAGERGEPVAVVHDLARGASRTLATSIYAVSPAGDAGFTLNFSRLHVLRPGYGYVAPHGPADETDLEPCPRDDGVWRVDLGGGSPRLLHSIADIAALPGNAGGVRPGAGDYNWVNHIQVDPTGQRFAFLHRFRPAGGQGWKTRLCACDADGRNLAVQTDAGYFSHYDWRDERTIMGHARDEQGTMGFYLYDVVARTRTPIAHDLLTCDGHNTFSPDRQWILTDTYPDPERYRTLMLYRPSDHRLEIIGRFFSPPELAGPCRCDLHPRWSRDGRQVCIDSAHSGARRMYVFDVAALMR